MKKIVLILLLLTNCVAENKALLEGQEVSAVNEKKEPITVIVPKDPQRVALLDYVAMDMLLTLGLEDKIVSYAGVGTPLYLKKMLNKKDLPNLGGLKEINMEKVMSSRPDLIFTSGRTISRYKKFKPIAPTIANFIDNKNAFQSFKNINLRNAKIFGKIEEVSNIITSYEERLQNLSKKAKGKTALVLITSGKSLRTLGENSRASLISREIGFDNLAKGIDSGHGNTTSYELILKLNPNYIFVIDKDTAISTKDFVPAQQQMNNELIQKTKAYQNDTIVYLDPSVWYLSEGGLKAMDIMLSNIENSL